MSVQTRLTYYTGAGAAGASVAYFLHERTESIVSPELVVFERSSQIGGRAETVTGGGDRLNKIEVGACDFSEDDSILNTVMRNVGLQPTYTEAALSEALGVWNGSTLQYSQTAEKPSWSNFAKMVWKYGSAPQSTQSLVDKTMDRLRSDFGDSSRTYKSGAEFVRRNALNRSTFTLAEPYLQQHGISRPFSTDIVQAATRAIYVQDLDTVHGFAALSAMASGRRRRVSIDRGLWRLFDRMIKLSDAQKRLNVEVTGITSHANGTFSLLWADASSAISEGNSNRNQNSLTVLSLRRHSIKQTLPSLLRSTSRRHLPPI